MSHCFQTLVSISTCVATPRGLTAAQLRAVGSSEAVEGKGGSRGGEGGGDKAGDEPFVNVNMEMVPPDTPLKEKDMLFLE
jgi:hypothetical protein